MKGKIMIKFKMRKNKQYHMKVLLSGFHGMVTLEDFVHRLKRYYYIVQRTIVAQHLDGDH